MLVNKELQTEVCRNYYSNRVEIASYRSLELFTELTRVDQNPTEIEKTTFESG